jgi:hypothetical protein
LSVTTVNTTTVNRMTGTLFATVHDENISGFQLCRQSSTFQRLQAGWEVFGFINKTTGYGIKKMYFLYIFSLSSTHLWLLCSKFFNPSEEKYFGFATDIKLGNKKGQRLISCPMYLCFHYYCLHTVLKYDAHNITSQRQYLKRRALTSNTHGWLSGKISLNIGMSLQFFFVDVSNIDFIRARFTVVEGQTKLTSVHSCFRSPPSRETSHILLLFHA